MEWSQTGRQAYAQIWHVPHPQQEDGKHKQGPSTRCTHISADLCTCACSTSGLRQSPSLTCSRKKASTDRGCPRVMSASSKASKVQLVAAVSSTRFSYIVRGRQRRLCVGSGRTAAGDGGAPKGFGDEGPTHADNLDQEQALPPN